VDKVDKVEEIGGQPHRIEQFWHCGGDVATLSKGNYQIGGESLLVVSPANEVAITEGWQSEVPGNKVPRPVIVVQQQVPLPTVMVAMLFLQPQPDVSLAVDTSADRIRLSAGETQWIELSWAAEPTIHWTELQHPG
jgi:hypothetical protein